MMGEACEVLSRKRRDLDLSHMFGDLWITAE